MIIYDYAGEGRDVDVDLDDDSIIIATMTVLTGDEVLEVITKDGVFAVYDSSVGNPRLTDWFDGKYVLVADGKWVADKDRFLARKHGYDYLWPKSGGQS